jgi:hypothetical protein
MFAKQILFALTALVTLPVVASAQGTLPGLSGSLSGSILSSGWVLTPPTLPSVQSKYGSYDRSIGNSWLGGSVHAYAGIVRQKSGTYELGNASVELRGVGRLLGYNAEVAEVIGNASNIQNNGVQSRSGMFRIEVLGYTVVNSTFTNNSTFASASQTFNLFPGGVNASVPVGPVTVSITGNAGCGYSRSANWLLPAAQAKVGLNATGSAYAFANAQVGVGIPGFGLGVGLQGNILQQSLSVNAAADAVWGLTGGANYQLQGITLTLYAWAQALYTWTTNLCSWSAGLVQISIF